MSHKKKIVTLDGPSGVGKSTISRKVAAALGYTYLDTGAMYRTVGLALNRARIDCQDEKKVGRLLDSINMELFPPGSEDGEVGVLLDGEDVSRFIRTPEASMFASRTSALPLVRSKLTQMQQQIGMNEKIVAEGRDTGTVVFPDAAHKFYLDADPRERAKRRVKQLHQQGSEVDESEILALIVKRDKNDTERTIAPLKKAEDAHVIDTSSLTINEVISTILNQIKRQTEGV